MGRDIGQLIHLLTVPRSVSSFVCDKIPFKNEPALTRPFHVSEKEVGLLRERLQEAVKEAGLLRETRDRLEEEKLGLEETAAGLTRRLEDLEEDTLSRRLQGISIVSPPSQATFHEDPREFKNPCATR